GADALGNSITGSNGKLPTDKMTYEDAKAYNIENGLVDSAGNEIPLSKIDFAEKYSSDLEKSMIELDAQNKATEINLKRNMEAAAATGPKIEDPGIAKDGAKIEGAGDSATTVTGPKIEDPGIAKEGIQVEGGLDANLLDDKGKFADDTLENNYQTYVNRKISKGQTPKDRLEWKKASDYWTKESPVARGNNFNKTVREADIYDYHEVYLENGKRLDSYDPDAGEIISRKATDLDKITEETYRGYLSEFSHKYSEGTKIRSNAYPELDGQELKGQYILEIPANNADISNIDYYKQIATEYDVILRFTEEVK
ncbi:MAG: hypothetical protein IKL04_07785, partial [Lachnospiraceae bacterium]|nr:hypothetical protein [Lachnospiraceae bacterium]